MGSDDLYKKRKARKNQSLARKKASRNSHDRVLIVCEGEKTEPNYFEELIQLFRLNSVKSLYIEIEGERCGSAPINVVDFAIKRYRQEKSDYDRVYCVFDKDSHVSYYQAKDKIRNKQKFYTIDSIPCFEFWLLLHFGYTSGSFSANGNMSICGSVTQKLIDNIPDYEKGAKNIASLLMPYLNDAIRNAKQLEQFHHPSQAQNPSTKVHELIEYLQSQKC